MTRYRNTYTTDDISVTFSADGELDHYGVPGSPTFLSINPESVDIIGLEILGVIVDPKAIPADLINALLDLSSECAAEWEPEELDDERL